LASSLASGGHGRFLHGPPNLIRVLASPVAVLAGSLLVVRLAPGSASTFWAIVSITAAAAALSAALAIVRRRNVTRWCNHTLKERISNFVDLMTIARKSVVLVTGSLHHGLYDQNDVVSALEGLEEGIKLTIYHESELDPSSGRFRKELERRKATFIRISPKRVSHGAIIDEKHCKIEQFGVDDAAEDKRVDYFAYDKQRARRALAEIKAVAICPENGGREAKAAA